VRLAGGSEVPLDAEVDVEAAPALEPHPAAAGEIGRLRHLPEPEGVRIEAPRLSLLALGHGELHVVEADERHGRSRGAEPLVSSRLRPHGRTGNAPPRARGARRLRGYIRRGSLFSDNAAGKVGL